MTAHCVRLSKPYSTDKALSFFFFMHMQIPAGTGMVIQDQSCCWRI